MWLEYGLLGLELLYYSMVVYLQYNVNEDNFLVFSDTFLSFMFSISQIGTWSRWLTDLFGMDDDDDSFEDKDDPDNNDERPNTSFRSFNLLYALSDLLMLPKDMLLSASIRKEVCQ